MSVAQFLNFTSWGNDKAAEWVESNNIQFRNFTVWDQYSEGIAAKTLIYNENPNSNYKQAFYNENIGGLVADSVIIGNSLPTATPTDQNTPSGLVLAWDRGELIKNVAFYNFLNPGSRAIRACEIIGRCQ